MATSAAAASAAGFTVDSTADAPDATPGDGVCAASGGACTLRAAVGEANALVGADSVTLPAGTYSLGSTITLASLLTLTGPAGARATVVDGAPNVAVLSLASAGVVVRGVTVTGGGPGLQVGANDVTVDQVAVRGNSLTSAGGAVGGGILMTSAANLTLTRSAVTANTATSTGLQAQGGGVYVPTGAVLTAVASTIAGNTASAPASTAFGGGILAGSGGQTVLRHVTLAGNVATGAGSTGGNLYRGGTVSVEDTIISGGLASFGANCSAAPTTVLGRNIDSGTSCGFGAGQLGATDPQLQALGDHGGPTDTMPLAATSPARDAAAACPAGGLDQRGLAVPVGAACDIGAAELAADLSVGVQASRADVPPGGDVTYVVRVRNGGPDPAPGAALDFSAGSGSVTLATTSAGSCPTAGRCDLGTLATGQEVTVTIVARAGSDPILLSARASSSVPDPAPGNDSALVSTPVTASPSAPAPPSTPSAAADTTPPSLGPLRRIGAARTGRPLRVGTTLSEASTITLRVERLLSGRRAGRTCRVGRRTGTRCTVARTAGVVRTRAVAGSSRVTIPARLAGKVLAAGVYRLTATAVDDAGNRSAPQRLEITVAPPAPSAGGGRPGARTRT